MVPLREPSANDQAPQSMRHVGDGGIPILPVTADRVPGSAWSAQSVAWHDNAIEVHPALLSRIGSH